jgi:hypothetical protein
MFQVLLLYSKNAWRPATAFPLREKAASGAPGLEICRKIGYIAMIYWHHE